MTTLGVPYAEARLLHVTARLQSGAVLPAWWPAPLDGVLAGQLRRDRLGDKYGLHPPSPSRAQLVADPHGSRDPEVAAYRAYHRTVSLPLVRTPKRSGCGSRWVWAATAATPVGPAVEDVRWWHQRFDDAAAAGRVDNLPASTDTGRYKSWRMPLVTTVTSHLEWWALGRRDPVAATLDKVESVGKKASQGEGMVLGWEVEDAGPPDWGPIQWVNGYPARPYPARCATWLGVDNPQVVPNTIRPPYWRAPLADGARTLGEVIAPWTKQPVPCTTP